MKKTLLFAAILMASISFSQSITVDDTLSSGVATNYYQGDTTFTDYSSITGTSVTYDYSLLTYLDNTVSMNLDTIINIADSPYSTDFASADYHENFTGGVNTFFSNSADSVTVYGFIFNDGTSDFVISYNVDPLKSFSFPMSVGDSYSDYIEGEAIDIPTSGSNTALSGNATVTVDGAGTLKLGGSTYTDIIRVKTIENLSGTVPFFGTVTLVRESYYYYSFSTSNMPVLIVGNIDVDGAGYVIHQEGVWSKDALGMAGVESTQLNEMNLNVYPNPASNEVNISTENADQLSIYNSVGQVVFTNNSLIKNEIIKVDISNYPQGIYFVQIQKEGELKTKKLVIK